MQLFAKYVDTAEAPGLLFNGQPTISSLKDCLFARMSLAFPLRRIFQYSQSILETGKDSSK